MEFNKKNSALLYLDKNGFYFFETGLQNIISSSFPETIIRDMDVINSVALQDQIKVFIEQYQLKPAAITIILSPHITFEKEFVDLKPEEQEENIQKFVDTIPFDIVISKTYQIEKGVKVIGSNKELYDELKKGFEKNSFSVDCIIPYQLLGTDQTLIQNLIPENALLFLKHLDRLRHLTMITVIKPSTMENTARHSVQDKTKPNKKRLIIMALVFIMLFIILGFMIINMK